MEHSKTKISSEGIKLKSFINEMHGRNLQNKDIVTKIMEDDWLLPDLMRGARKNKAVHIVRIGLRSVVSEILKRPAGDSRQSDLFGIEDALMQSAVEIGETKLTVPNGIMGFDLVPINKFSMSKEGARQLYKAYKYKKLKAQETDLSAGRIHSHLEEILSVKGWSYAEIVGH